MAQAQLVSGAVSVGRRTDDSPAADAPLDTDLSAWLGRCAAGDAAAFAALYDATSSRIYGLVLTVVRSRCRAAKVTQAVYVEIYYGAGSISTGPVAPMAAMLSLAHRRAVEEVRRTVNEPLAALVAEVPDKRDRLSLPRSARLQAVVLDPVQQEVLVLAYLGGYTVRQVSALLSLPTATVRMAISTALSSGLGSGSSRLPPSKDVSLVP
ncbi:MAG TPA: sigma factor-like helix-turn-helix DNA-binding protein [Propionibacteriaceae bacterium]